MLKVSCVILVFFHFLRDAVRLPLTFPPAILPVIPLGYPLSDFSSHSPTPLPSSLLLSSPVEPDASCRR